jgi:hypothetical protein
LINLGHGHAIADGRLKWDESEMELVKRVVVDSLSLVRQRLLLFLFRRGKHRPAAPLKQLAQACRTTVGEIKRVTNQFVFSGLLEVDRDSGDEPWFKLSLDIYKSLERMELLKWERK